MTEVYPGRTTPTGRGDQSVLVCGITNGADWHVELSAATAGIAWGTFAGDCTFSVAERKEIGQALTDALQDETMYHEIMDAAKRDPHASLLGR